MNDSMHQDLTTYITRYIESNNAGLAAAAMTWWQKNVELRQVERTKQGVMLRDEQPFLISFPSTNNQPV